MESAISLPRSNRRYTVYLKSGFAMQYTPKTLNTRLDVHPGEWYFGGEYRSIQTILGSCVSSTAWHPKLIVGGLCHFILPETPANPSADNRENPARYANTALFLMKQAMQHYAPLREYQLGLFGGSNITLRSKIGQQNIHYAQHWMAKEKITATHVDVGENFSRTITLNILTGGITVKRYSM